MKKFLILLISALICFNTYGQDTYVGKLIDISSPIINPDYPPLPCIMFGLETTSCKYILSINSHWICGELIVESIEYFFDDEVEITGTVTVHQDIYSDEYFNLEIESIKKLISSNNVTLIANPTVGGTVTGGGTGFTENDEITVIATPNENYIFVNWTNGNTEVSTDAEYTFTVTETVTLTANFEIETGISSIYHYKITIYPNPAIQTLYFNKETVFEIVDLQGKILLKSETAVKSLNINSLQAGIYFVKTGNIVQKFIVDF